MQVLALHFQLLKIIKTTRIAWSKLNGIEAYWSNEITHENFRTIINKEKNYRELKESIRMMESPGSDTEKYNLIQEIKIIGIHEIIKRNEIINNNLKSQV